MLSDYTNAPHSYKYDALFGLLIISDVCVSLSTSMPSSANALISFFFYFHLERLAV
jgi:hypothetical protein